MMSYLNQLLFGVYPYVAGTVFLVGSLVRFDRDQFTWKAGSSQMLRQRNMVIASNLFHVGILGIFFGHLVGLLTPPEIFHALGVSPGAKQMLAVVAGGVFGLLCLVGLVMLVYRRLTDPRINATSTAMDIFVLLLLLAQLCLGLITLPVSLHHLDGANMLQLMSWARNIVTFDPSVAVGSLAGVGWLFKTHLLLGMTVFLVFPFSRLVHIWSAPLGYVRRPWQIVRQR
jgi:nitrate reductase gamma subunit